MVSIHWTSPIHWTPIHWTPINYPSWTKVIPGVISTSLWAGCDSGLWAIYRSVSVCFSYPLVKIQKNTLLRVIPTIYTFSGISSGICSDIQKLLNMSIYSESSH
jgi:hypothetical protein